MKRFTLACAFAGVVAIGLIWPVRLHGAAAFVQFKLSSGFVAGADTFSFTSPVTAGNTVLVMALTGSSASTYSIADLNSNSYTAATFTNSHGQVWCIKNPSLTPSNVLGVTVTASDTAAVGKTEMREYSGLDCTFDGIAGVTSPSAITPLVTDTFTTACTSAVLFEGFRDPFSATDTAPAPWTNSDVTGGAVNHVFADQIGVAAGSYHGTATNSSTGTTWYGIAAGVKVTGATCGGGVTFHDPTGLLGVILP